MSFFLPAPLRGQAVPLVAVLAALTWLFLVSSGQHRWARRAAIVLYLIALALATAYCIAWLAGLSR